MEQSGFHYVSIGRPVVKPVQDAALREVSNG